MLIILRPIIGLGIGGGDETVGAHQNAVDDFAVAVSFVMPSLWGWCQITIFDSVAV